MAIDPARLSPAHRDFVRHELERRRTGKPVPAATCSVNAQEFDSNAEARFAQYVNALVRSDAKYWDGSEVLEVAYHCQKFRVGARRWYTPDFGLLIRDIDGWIRFRLIEVKGSWDSKNARESRAKLEAAAMMYRWFEWEAALVDGRGFVHEVVGEQAMCGENL